MEQANKTIMQLIAYWILITPLYWLLNGSCSFKNLLRQLSTDNCLFFIMIIGTVTMELIESEKHIASA